MNREYGFWGMAIGMLSPQPPWYTTDIHEFLSAHNAIHTETDTLISRKRPSVCMEIHACPWIILTSFDLADECLNLITIACGPFTFSISWNQDGYGHSNWGLEKASVCHWFNQWTQQKYFFLLGGGRKLGMSKIYDLQRECWVTHMPQFCLTTSANQVFKAKHENVHFGQTPGCILALMLL